MLMYVYVYVCVCVCVCVWMVGRAGVRRCKEMQGRTGREDRQGGQAGRAAEGGGRTYRGKEAQYTPPHTHTHLDLHVIRQQRQQRGRGQGSSKEGDVAKLNGGIRIRGDGLQHGVEGHE